MPSRAELVARANVLGIDTTTAKMANDSALEQRVLWNEKRATAVTGTIATTTLTSTGTAVSDGDTVTLASRVWTAKTALTETAATGTLTSDATIMAAGDTVTIGSQTYTFMATLDSAATPSVNQVLINGSAANGLTNLSRALGLTGTPGTDYSLGTKANPEVNLTSVGATTLVVTAKAVGTYGNSIATVETSSHLSWGAAFLASGANSVANEVLIGSTADGSAFLSNLKKAINGSATAGTNYSSVTSTPSKHVTGSTLTGTTLLINALEFAIGNGDIATTETSSQLSFTSTVMASGAPKVIVAAASADLISGDAETFV